MSAVFILHEERKKLQTFPASLNEIDFWISTLGFRFSKRTEVPSQRSRTDGIQFLSTRQVFQSRVSFRLSVSSSPRCCQWHRSLFHPRPSRASSPTFSHSSRFPLLSSVRESCNSRERVCRDDPDQPRFHLPSRVSPRWNQCSPHRRTDTRDVAVASRLVSSRLVSTSACSSSPWLSSAGALDSRKNNYTEREDWVRIANLPYLRSWLSIRSTTIVRMNERTDGRLNKLGMSERVPIKIYPPRVLLLNRLSQSCLFWNVYDSLF